MPLQPTTSLDLLLKKQGQTNYANYIIQQQAFTNGDRGYIITQSGSGATKQAQNVVLLQQAIAETTEEERQAFLNSAFPPVSSSISPAPGPIISSTESILAFSRYLYSNANSLSPTISSDSLTINGNVVGNYEYVTKTGNITISSFTASDYFTSTEDTVSSWIIINGNLTINSGQTFTPSVRKLFTVVYISGNLTNNGTISMTARGANHSGTGNSGGYTAPVDIRIGTGTFGAVSNPQIPATGGAGAVAKTGGSFNNGTAGTLGGTGGGGTGESITGTTAAAGSAGTCFTGGTGSGGALSGTSQAGTANGGAGGNSSGAIAGGGTGNPGGLGSVVANNGISGTGGTLIVIVGGILSGTGSFVSNGSTVNRPPGAPAGGGSGGGSVTVLFGTDSSTTTTTATGGAGIASGNGGNGTARKLAIGAN